MSERLVEIKAQLLDARKEAERELSTIDKALDAIGVQREQAKAKQVRRTGKTSAKSGERPISRGNMDRILSIIKESDRPLRTTEVAARMELGRESVGKGISWLVREGKIRQVGFVPGKGRIGLYKAVEENEMSDALKPGERQGPEITRIEDEQRRMPPRVSPSSGHSPA